MLGWELVTVDLGIGQFMMWRLPGYGDVLAQLEPELRDRQASDGAPPGFEDAVAWMTSTGGDARWHVTFAVDDADAVAARTAELGGEIRVAPYDAGVVRTAVLADPHGAEFSINRFDPG